MTATETPAPPASPAPVDAPSSARGTTSAGHPHGTPGPTSPQTLPPKLPWWTLVIRLVLAVVLIAGGVAVFAMLQATAPQLDEAAADRARTRVLTYTPIAVPVQRPFRGYGTARPLDATNVPARVTATVIDVPDNILDGAAVSAGDLLAELDPTDFTAEVERLDAALAELDATLAQLDTQESRLTERLALEEEDLAIATAELARVQRLAERNVATDQDLDRARSAELAARRALTLTRETLDTLTPRRTGVAAQRAGLQAQRRLADENLARTRVTAPIAGVLQTVTVEPGESVAPGQQVARIVDPTVLEVPIQLPAAAQSAVSVGDAVTLRPTNDPQRVFTATIARVAPEVDPASRSLTVFALLDQRELPMPQRLAPGTFVEADVLTGDATPRLTIPRRAIRKQRVQAVRPDEQGISKIVSIAVEPLYPLRQALPETGLDDEEWAVLANDALPGGVEILATGSSTLLDGQAVTPVSKAATPEATP